MWKEAETINTSVQNSPAQLSVCSPFVPIYLLGDQAESMNHCGMIYDQYKSFSWEVLNWVTNQICME